MAAAAAMERAFSGINISRDEASEREAVMMMKYGGTGKVVDGIMASGECALEWMM